MNATKPIAKPQRLKILIVSSDSSEAKNTGALIEQKISGAKAIYAENLQTALNAVKRHEPHAVVTDLHLTKAFSGLELAKKLSQTKTPIIGFAPDNFYVRQPKDAFEKTGALFVDANKQNHEQQLLRALKSLTQTRRKLQKE